MYSISSHNNKKYFHQQDANENDQLSPRKNSTMEQLTDYSDNTQAFIIDEDEIQDWESFQEDISQSDQTTSFGFQQQQQQDDTFQYNQEINSEIDYETIIRSNHLYYDPNPQIIQKPTPINPVVYNQNIMIRFLQPPPVKQEPLIIREVRPPQPPPPPPLIIRQHAPPPPSPPPPLILRERPPPIPPMMTAQVITKQLPPIPPPPRSVIMEKLPPLPAKPQDIIIERWIPYELMHKRKVIVHRAEEPKAYPPPKNVIITYEPVQVRVIRQIERLDVKPEDPHHYSALYGNSLYGTEQLLAQIRELGITEDLSPPHILKNAQQTSFNVDEQNYAPTYENLVNGLALSTNYEGSNDQNLSNGEDLSTQLAQYGMTAESIPY